MNDDEHHASNREIAKTYFSKSWLDKFKNLKMKFAHKILDHDGNEFLLKDEMTLGINSNGKRQLKALFLQDSRKIEKLIIQQFGAEGNPIKNQLKEASFHGAEVERLHKFLKSIKEVDFPNDATFNILDSELEKMLLNKDQAIKLVSENIDILQEALTNNITAKDLINFGYRKNQLVIFEKLLNNHDFFLQYKNDLVANSGKEMREEAVWQAFFEQNTWILGYGLDYIFNSELDSKKLEQVTAGSNFFSKGKRIDALFKSLGIINSLCFCELKLSSHLLLKEVKNAYREESWQISEHLSGAIAQVQRTVQKALSEISTKTEIKDAEDNLTGESLFLYYPKAFILIGSLNEFVKDERINEIKFSSFEMFRKNLRNVDILTYDELYERAYYICHKKEK